MSVEDVQGALTPPRKPKDTGSPTAWAAAESALGITFPGDFKAFIATYGSGTIGKVISLLNPMSVDWTGAPAAKRLPQSLAAVLDKLNPFGTPREQWVTVLGSTLAVCETVPSVFAGRPGRRHACAVWPAQPGLFPWARGDSGQALLWWTEGAPENWPTVLADPTEGLRSYDMDMTSLVAGWLAGSVILDWLPPPSKPLFSRVEL